MNKLPAIFARTLLAAVFFAGLMPPGGNSASAAPRQEIVAGYAAVAKSQDKAFTDFSAKRGRDLFLARPAGGKPDTPSCTTCHTSSPTGVGQTRAGKVIAPMAVSKSPDRYGDRKKVEKWFRRNCKSVLGRSCTALEKGDFLTFMITQ